MSLDDEHSLTPVYEVITKEMGGPIGGGGAPGGGAGGAGGSTVPEHVLIDVVALCSDGPPNPP